MARDGELYQVATSSYVAGIMVQDGRVVKAAPILRWAIGRTLEELRGRVGKQGGTVVVVSTGQP